MGWRGGNACIYERTFALTCGGVVEPLLDAVADRLRLEGSEVLDVGSGTGRLAAAAARRGAVVTAVDPDPAMIREAQRLRPDAASRWLVAGAPTLPFPDGGFDVVTLAFILNHVPSPESTLRHCARALRPGGVLAIAVWGDSGLVEAWDAVLGVPGAVRLPTPQLPPEEDFARTAEGLAELCGRAGLTARGRSQPAWTVRISVDELWQAPLAGLARIGRQVAAQTPAVQAAMLQALRSHAKRAGSSEFLTRPPRSSSPAPAADRVVGSADP